MTMRRTVDLWPCGMDRRVDHVRRGIEQPAGAARDDLPVVVDLDEIGRLDLGEGDAEGVDPEGGRVDGVAQGDVARDAFVEAILAEDAECGGQSALQVLALLVFVLEDGRLGEGHLDFGLLCGGLLGLLRGCRCAVGRRAIGGEIVCGRWGSHGALYVGRYLGR